MKIKTYKIKIENFERFYETLYKQHSEILGSEYDKEKEELKVSYEDSACELTQEQLKNMKLPIILKFRKKLPTTDIPNARFTSENEFVVETFDVKTARKLAKQKHPDFEEQK